MLNFEVRRQAVCVNAQDVFQNAKELEESGEFIEAGEAYQRACELYRVSGKHNRLIDCIIHKTQCLIKPHLHDPTILTESNARETLRPYLDGMKEEIEGEFQNKRIRYNSLRRAYLQIEKLYDEYGFIAEASECFCRSMDYRRRLARRESKLRWLFLWILKVTCRYGERGWWLLIWVFGFIFSFGTSYRVFKLIEFSKENAGTPDFWDSLYFSVVTFTTLGFGDMQPICLAGRIVAGFEAIFGYAMLGLFVSIMASKIMQR